MNGFSQHLQTSLHSFSLHLVYFRESPIVVQSVGVIVSEVLKYVKNVTESFQIDRNFDLLYIYIYILCIC